MQRVYVEINWYIRLLNISSLLLLHLRKSGNFIPLMGQPQNKSSRNFSYQNPDESINAWWMAMIHVMNRPLLAMSQVFFVLFRTTSIWSGLRNRPERLEFALVWQTATVFIRFDISREYVHWSVVRSVFFVCLFYGYMIVRYVPLVPTISVCFAGTHHIVPVLFT